MSLLVIHFSNNMKDNDTFVKKIKWFKKKIAFFYNLKILSRAFPTSI
jgi:hypothetical protein